MSDLLLQIEDLSVGLKDNKDSNPLVNKLSFKVKRNQILGGLVGESGGAGKTLTMMAIANLLSQDLFWTSGTVDYIGTNNERLHLSELRMKNEDEKPVVLWELYYRMPWEVLIHIEKLVHSLYRH